ncbi:MAG: hypothetical protein JXA09_02225, partial [Anaerolineae bacterium]|nr:hypothetical protein [Anaerolineae bacterium]
AGSAELPQVGSDSLARALGRAQSDRGGVCTGAAMAWNSAHSLAEIGAPAYVDAPQTVSPGRAGASDVA